MLLLLFQSSDGPAPIIYEFVEFDDVTVAAAYFDDVTLEPD
jgi:hypothetical protein